MEYRRFRDSDVKTSLLGMGCMRLPCVGGPESDVDLPAAEAIIDYAYAHGINYFDSAYVYHGGKSEAVMGRALSKYPRESYMMATKLPGFMCRSAEDVRRIFSEQLERAGTDYFDFYLCHNVNEGSIANYMAGYILPELMKFKAEGKIRRLGFSSHGAPETLEKFADAADWDFAQIQLNYFDWSYQNAQRQYEILTKRGIPVVVMEPVRGGRLASVTPEADRLFRESAPDMSVASWALRWAASHPNVQVVLSGMSTLAQVEDNIATFESFRPISEAEQRVIDSAVEALRKLALVPCTGCRYCVDECPQGLDIPALIETWNDYNIDNNPFELFGLRELPQNKLPGKCIACRACVARCPQKIEIPVYLSKLAGALEKAPPPPPGL